MKDGYVKLRTGVMDSSWAEEMPRQEIVRLEDWEKRLALAREQERRAEEWDEQPPVGSCVNVRETGDGVTLDIVVADLSRDAFLRSEYQCRACRGRGCGRCESRGWRDGESRHVVLTGPRRDIASLCITRYYEAEDDDGED